MHNSDLGPLTTGKEPPQMNWLAADLATEFRSFKQYCELNIMWTKFTAMIEPKSNFRLNRFNLQKFKQSTTESGDECMTRCKTQARKCQFRDAVET